VDLRQIQYFVALVEDGSMTLAAKRLNVVQPTLSMQISKLEDELGQLLFERRKQGMQPTSAGRLMYRLYEPLLRDFEKARNQLLQRADSVTGHVSIGLLASMSESILPEVIGQFHKRYPNVEVTVSVGYSTNLIDWVTSGQIDAAVINKPRGKLSLLVESLAEEDMLLVAGNSAPRLPSTVRLSRLGDLALELVLPTKRHGLRSVLDSAAQQEGLVLAPKFEIDALGAIVRLVESGAFASVLPRMLVQRALKKGDLQACPILSPRIVREVVWVSHPKRPLSAPSHALIDIIGDEVRKTLDITE